MMAPIFFGMNSVEASIYDTNFEDKIGLLSTKHLHWEKLTKEHVHQQENTDKDNDKVLGRLIKSGEESVSKIVTTGSFVFIKDLFDCSFIQVFTLPKGKWKEDQDMLCTFSKVI